MRQGAQPCASETDRAAQAWDRMMLSSTSGGLTAHQLTSTGLAEALALIEAGFAAVSPTRAGGGRAVPSAGAIYPYECHVVTAEAAGLAVFYADPARRSCYRTSVHDPFALTAQGIGPTALGQDEALIVIVTRPWLSMRKYGDRGYLYCQLDTAHLATNLLGVAANRGLAAELSLRFPRKAIEELVPAGDRCREIHSVLRIARSGGCVATPRWSVFDASGQPEAVPESPSWLEEASWRSFGPPAGDAPPESPAERALVPLRPEFPVEWSPDLAVRWCELSRDRSSSKAFRPGPVPAAALWGAVSAMHTPLVTDLPVETELQVTLVCRAATGLEPGVFRLRDNGIGAGTPPRDDEVVRACMNQEHLRHAAALVLFHVARGDLLGRDFSLREALFRAGALGHLLYLGATACGVGVTGVGGFDASTWRRLAGLPDDHEVLYLMAFGRDSGPGVKTDRLQTAYAHDAR